VKRVGADLRIIKTGREFSDPYNVFGVFAGLQLSWWDLNDEFKKRKWLSNGILKLSGVKYLYNLVKQRNIQTEGLRREYERDKPYMKHRITFKQLLKNISNRKALLLNFLEEAIKNKSAIEWSV
jgi:hypothetical protein